MRAAATLLLLADVVLTLKTLELAAIARWHTDLSPATVELDHTHRSWTKYKSLVQTASTALVLTLVGLNLVTITVLQHILYNIFVINILAAKWLVFCVRFSF